MNIRPGMRVRFHSDKTVRDIYQGKVGVVFKSLGPSDDAWWIDLEDPHPDGVARCIGHPMQLEPALTRPHFNSAAEADAWLEANA